MCTCAKGYQVQGMSWSPCWVIFNLLFSLLFPCVRRHVHPHQATKFSNLPRFKCCGCVQAAYAFKATYQNGGHGLNFSNLHDYNNHWIYATCVCAVETILAIALALYLEQVLASGTGVRRHPLFFLQRRKSAGGSGEAAPRPHRGPFTFLKKNRGSGQGLVTETVPKPGMSVLRMLFRGQRPQQSGATASKVIQVPSPPPSLPSRPLLLLLFCCHDLSDSSLFERQA